MIKLIDIAGRSFWVDPAAVSSVALSQSGVLNECVVVLFQGQIQIQTKGTVDQVAKTVNEGLPSPGIGLYRDLDNGQIRRVT